MKLKENLLKSMLQGDIEEFEAEYNKFNKKGLQTDRGAIVRGAIRAGWLVDVPDDFDVKTAKPGIISKWAGEIDKIYTEAVTPDPN